MSRSQDLRWSPRPGRSRFWGSLCQRGVDARRACRGAARRNRIVNEIYRLRGVFSLKIGGLELVRRGRSGLTTSLQARVNGELAKHLANGVQAALISFVTGLLILTIAVVAVASVRRGVMRIPAAVASGQLPWWATLGGFLGGAFIACQSFAVALGGAALFAVSTVAGQAVSSLLVDRAGLSPLGKVPVTTQRLTAAFMTVVAVVIAASGRLGAVDFSAVAVVAAITAGALVAVQQAINGRTNVVTGNPVATTWVDFVFGTLGLAVAVAVVALIDQTPMELPTSGPWWMCLGGALGVVFIMTNAWAVPRYGVLVFALVSIAGQLASALVIDLVAPMGGNSVQWSGSFEGQPECSVIAGPKTLIEILGRLVVHARRNSLWNNRS